jgi:RHS repeat-associated protein
VTHRYAWGVDLGGTWETGMGNHGPGRSQTAAGGVGALLGVIAPNTQTYSATHDANGNVMGFIDLETGTLAARFDYDAFGTLITDWSAPGHNAWEISRIRFSGKYQDPHTGWLYYGYRYLDTVNGRWVSRDPIGEEGGLNLYGYVGNSPTALLDPMGLCCESELKAWQDSIDDYRIKLKEHDQALKAIILQNKVVQLARGSFAAAVGLEYSEFLNVLKNCVGNSYKTSCRNATKRWFAAMAAAEVARRVLSNEKEDLEMKKVEARDKKTAASRAEALVDKSKDSYIKCMFP